jgi:hypothetical protein
MRLTLFPDPQISPLYFCSQSPPPPDPSGHTHAPRLPFPSPPSPSLGLTPRPWPGSQPLIQPQLFPGRGVEGFLQTNSRLRSERGPSWGRG